MFCVSGLRCGSPRGLGQHSLSVSKQAKLEQVSQLSAQKPSEKPVYGGRFFLAKMLAKACIGHLEQSLGLPG